MSRGAARHNSFNFPSVTELYPIYLIFSFDNQRINEYFKWENSPFSVEFGLHSEIGNFRLLHYNMPAPFMVLVGRENFIAWRNSRSTEEILTENIAISFINYFDISIGDFTNANNDFVASHLNLARRQPRVNSRWEIYPVDLIFTFDNEAINEFFRWENSPAEHERDWGAS